MHTSLVVSISLYLPVLKLPGIKTWTISSLLTFVTDRHSLVTIHPVSSRRVIEVSFGREAGQFNSPYNL